MRTTGPEEPSSGPDRPRRAGIFMRFVTIYLVAYFALVAGALFALWAGGALQQFPASWIVIGLMIAVGLGVMLALSARTHVIPED